MTLSLGINPITWSNDDLQHVGGDVTLATCLAEATQAGYDGVELGHKFPRDAGVLRPILDEHGLSLVSGWYSGRLLERNADAEIEAMAMHARLLEQMGCSVLIFAEVTGCIHSNPDARLSRRPRVRATDWKRFGKRLSAVSKACADRGLTLCYHHHMGTIVQSANDIEAMMQESDANVHLLLDTGHAFYAGADPVTLANRYADRIGHLHCKDVRETVLRRCMNRDSSFLDAVLDGVFTVPGDGCIEFPRVFAALAKVDYSGWAVVEAEQDPSVARPIEYARLGYENLSKLVP
jgi:inosose dehydratase